MAFSNQSTKLRLLKLLQHSWSTQPNTTVSLSELAQTLNVSRERVRQLYHQLAVEYALPPIQKRKLNEINQRSSDNQTNKLNTNGEVIRKLRTPSPQTLALEADVRKYISQNMSVPEIARKTGRSESNIERIHHRLHIPLPPKQKSPQTQELEALVRKYSEQGLNAPEIARKIGKNRKSVYSVFRRLGLPFKWVKVTELRNPKTHAFDAEVKWYYFSLGMSSKEIASITRRDMKTVYAALHRLGVPLKKQSRRSG